MADNGVVALKSGHGTEGKHDMARKGSVVANPPKGQKIMVGGGGKNVPREGGK